MDSSYDIVAVGSGFATTFFLHAYLKRAPAKVRVLVLERGNLDTHAWQVKNRRNQSLDAGSTFLNATPEKAWGYVPAFGGGSNGWWACTPRFMPSDFSMRSSFGVGRDWPMTYEELEPFYEEAEQLMSVSGPSDGSPYPRRKPYPQSPIRFSDPDRVLKKAYPDAFYQQPSARARDATKNRPACCGSGVCGICPINSKFTIQNEMMHVYDDPRVSLSLASGAERIEISNGTARGIHYTRDGESIYARADMVVLGANGFFNPHLLLRSGVEGEWLGKGLHEQASIMGKIDLDGVDNFQGSTSITGHGYMLYDGPHRSDRAACLIETWNMPFLRAERGKWRQRLQVKFILEVLPELRNGVSVDAEQPNRPNVRYEGHSRYTDKTIAMLPDLANKVFGPLPVERLSVGKKLVGTDNHIISTTMMGMTPDDSVVDRHLLHHQLRNVAVLGSGSFPTGSPANPTLTIAALSLWSAHHCMS